MRTCLLLFLVSSWEPWFPQVAAIHTYLGAFTLQVACSSTKNYNHISHLSSSSSHSISVPNWIPKHVLGSFLAFYSVFLFSFMFQSIHLLPSLLLFGAFHLWSFLILPVDRNAGNCLVKGSTCAPFQTSALLRDPPQEPAKEHSGAAAADRTPTPKSVTESPNTKRKLRTGTVQILSHSKLYNSQA